VSSIAHRVDARGHFHQHAFVQQILLRAIEPQVCHLAFQPELDELKILDQRRTRRQGSQHFRHSYVHATPARFSG
jgi:hypothetical protein